MGGKCSKNEEIKKRVNFVMKSFGDETIRETLT
jgi:hypothetical protein